MVQPSTSNEKGSQIEDAHHLTETKARILNDALQDIGMGRYQWGLFVVAGFGWLAVGSDVWGRKISFNLTLLITDFITLTSLAALWSIGVGGNLPVDSSIFLEFVPASHQYLLTVLSIWWAFGQLLGSLVAWPLIGNFSCEPPSCARASNQGWRCFLFAMGGLMLFLWAFRFFVFTLYESPKYLMGAGRDDEAVQIVHRVEEYNGTTSDLTMEQLRDAGTAAAVQRKLSVFSGNHVKSLFATRKLAYSTSLLIQVILSVIGVPGALLAGYLVELPILGRRGTLAISTLLTGVFILASTTARSSDALLGFNCAYSFTSNVMYGVLYALSPELFPTKDRGTGNALVATANRVFGIMAPIVALYGNLTTSVPIYIAGALFLVSGFIALLLPFESRGRASL
ncbi:major facilitator superfamily domain-containing protein [Mycena sp. CBHHK59/15]|nr:major facilitator superfamily domain-containing protein [Mycena sp. CBHHK59/15]